MLILTIYDITLSLLQAISWITSVPLRMLVLMVSLVFLMLLRFLKNPGPGLRGVSSPGIFLILTWELLRKSN